MDKSIINIIVIENYVQKIKELSNNIQGELILVFLVMVL